MRKSAFTRLSNYPNNDRRAFLCLSTSNGHQAFNLIYQYHYARPLLNFARPLCKHTVTP